ncbi:uncharacterized protein LOC110914741 [Helianthus annuus]|uniref:uncharacterized protein LOC110914741 n=1 Tax=Helianthus annuus TaxID=4232 RepID=UPI000B8EFE7B|nr:uncharacterized protein LOC110914741 [Helianthus annuus]
MHSKVMVKAQVQDCDADLDSPFESLVLGLRYLIELGTEKESQRDNKARHDSITKARRVCVSNFAMAVATPTSKGPGQRKTHQIKDVQIQRPRAVLSSPDNDHLIGEMNKKASKQNSTTKTREWRVNLDRVDGENAHRRIRGTTRTFNA